MNTTSSPRKREPRLSSRVLNRNHLAIADTIAKRPKSHLKALYEGQLLQLGVSSTDDKALNLTTAWILMYCKANGKDYIPAKYFDDFLREVATVEDKEQLFFAECVKFHSVWRAEQQAKYETAKVKNDQMRARTRVAFEERLKRAKVYKEQLKLRTPSVVQGATVCKDDNTGFSNIRPVHLATTVKPYRRSNLSRCPVEGCGKWGHTSDKCPVVQPERKEEKSKDKVSKIVRPTVTQKHPQHFSNEVRRNPTFTTMPGVQPEQQQSSDHEPCCIAHSTATTHLCRDLGRCSLSNSGHQAGDGGRASNVAAELPPMPTRKRKERESSTSHCTGAEVDNIRPQSSDIRLRSSCARLDSTNHGVLPGLENSSDTVGYFERTGVLVNYSLMETFDRWQSDSGLPSQTTSCERNYRA